MNFYYIRNSTWFLTPATFIKVLLWQHMVEESIREKIKQKIASMSYNSANFQFGLIKENEEWKIAIGRIVLDIDQPQGHKTLIELESLRLEDFSVSIKEFEEFLEFLGKSNIGNIQFIDSTPQLTELNYYTLGNYRLCIIGNFPTDELYFLTRQMGRDYHGIDKPTYHLPYAVNTSVMAKSFARIDLTGYAIPFRTMAEAINHFWGTKYDLYQLQSNGFNLYFPIYSASITRCKVKDTQVKLELDIATNLVKPDQLSIGIIAQNQNQTFRDRYKVLDKTFEIKLELIPEDIHFYLIKDTEKLDEYYWQSQEKQKRTSDIIAGISSEKGSRTSLRKGVQTTTFEGEPEEESVNLFAQNLIEKLPEHLQILLTEAENAYNNDLYRATCILLRTALEEAITLILKQTGNEKEIYNDRNYEVGLQKKIDRLVGAVPTYGQMKKELENIKWFGDNATHEAIMPFYKKDIVTTLEPQFRKFLAKMIELKAKSE